MPSLQITAPLTVSIAGLVSQQKVSSKQLYEFCQENPELRIEQTAEGEIIVMPPAFSDTGNRNFKLAVALGVWAEKDGTGEGFDSSTGFTLPNGAMRSPDAAWIKSERWDALTGEQKASFAPICPDFVIELKSSSDALIRLKKKMEEYIDNGVQLGLLVDRQKRAVYVYRPGRVPEVLMSPLVVNCSPELPGFELPMTKIW